MPTATTETVSVLVMDCQGDITVKLFDNQDWLLQFIRDEICRQHDTIHAEDVGYDVLGEPDATIYEMEQAITENGEWTDRFGTRYVCEQVAK